jgi:hypothetical protein
MGYEKYIDNKKDFSLYVASVQAEYDQVNALHAETLEELEAAKGKALAANDTESVEKISEFIEGALKMKENANSAMESLYWARDNFFNDEGAK